MGISTDYHEPYEALPEEAREVHRAVATIIEELEAVDWYNQRAAATGDDALARIILHNRDEEIEHAVMALEWLRRRLPKLDEELRTYLFTEGEITEIEEEKEGSDSKAESAPETSATSHGLGLGRLHCNDDERTG